MSGQLYDVAIIGYGPTGATAANLLGQLGLRVVVIERDLDIYDRARAISTDEEVMRIWQSVGLAERLQEDMLPERPIAFVDAAGVPLIETVFTRRGCGHPAQQFIYQPVVDQVLREGVSRFPDVEVLVEHECLRVLNSGGHVELLIADLRNDSLKRVRASYVIAADGGSSSTRSHLGVGYSGKTYAERWVVVDTEVLKEWDAHDRLRFHCDPAQPTVDCPTPLGHHRWEFPASPGEDDKALVSDAAIWEVLHNQGITEDHVRVLRAVVYSHHVRVADRWRVGRVFLAGDAAHAMPPWIGQGMSAGVRDVANLCWKLAAVLRNGAPESLLDSFERERKPHAIEVTRRAVRVGRIITERRGALVTMRNRALRAVSTLPGAPALIQKMFWVPTARFREGYLAPHRHAAIGWQIPQPWVTGPTGARVRLDDLLAGRWALLYTDAPPAGASAWTSLGVIHIRASGGLTRWLRSRKACAVVVRPDGFIYAACDSTNSMPPPPHGLNPSAYTERPIRNGVHA